MQKISRLFKTIIEYKISIKELYFSLTSWFVLLVTFLGFATRFYTDLWITNIIMALSVYLIISLVINRVLLSGFLTLLLAVSFDYIKLIKWQFLMQDLSASDFLMLQLLINHGLLRLIYEYATKEIYLIVILLLINFILLWNKSDTLLDRKHLGTKNFYSLRLLSLGVALLLTMKLFDIAADKQSYLYRSIESSKAKTQQYTHKAYGPFADIFLTIRDIHIKPKYGKEGAGLILGQLSVEQDMPPINLAEMPDIIVILNESTFDPKKLDYDFADQFDFSYFQNNEYTKYNGIMNVNTFGGSSWISEYEVNTGITHKSFEGPGYMPFITLVPLTEKSVMSYLRNIGYQTEIIYPVDKNFSLAEKSYLKLGANKITDIYEYGFKPDSWGNIPDTMIGEMILASLEKDNQKPKYIFASTMLNHGPHASFFPDKIGCSRVMNDKLCSKLNDYLTRLEKTNRDQTELIKQLMQRKKKTIIVNFGDHLPSFEGYSTQLRFTRDIKDYYKTFYHIHANFDLTQQETYPNLDINLIPGLVLDMAGLNNDLFYQANSLIRRKCQGNLDICKEQPENIKLLESYKSLVVEQLNFPN